MYGQIYEVRLCTEIAQWEDVKTASVLTRKTRAGAKIGSRMTRNPRDDGGESNATDDGSLDRTKLSNLKPIPPEISFWHIKLGNNRCHPSRITIRKKDDLQCGKAESSMVPYDKLEA